MRRLLLHAFALALVAAAVVGGTMWIYKDPRQHIVVDPGGGCENPPPDVGCDPTPAQTEPRGHTIWMLTSLAVGGAVFWIAYTVMARRARRFESAPLPSARIS